jgi:hypothetical protein
MEAATLESRLAASGLTDPAGSLGSAGPLGSADPLGPEAADLIRAANRHAELLRVLAIEDRTQARELAAASSGSPVRLVDELLRDAGNAAERRLGGLLSRALRPTPAPAELRRRDALDVVREQVTEAAALVLRSSPAGDLIAAGFAPLQAPVDADWAASALEELEGRALEGRAKGGTRSTSGFSLGSLGDPSQPGVQTPGWLWARIRGEVRSTVLSIRRRKMAFRLAMAAAGVLVSTLVYGVFSRSGAGPSDSPEIVFHRVDQPLSDQYSTAALVRRLRDVR